MKTATKFERPTHRVIYDRRTGEPVRQPVPIAPSDWPYGELHPSELLWRYMDFWKFEGLVRNAALYFSRPDQFKDPFEGRFSPGNANGMSPSDAAFYSAYRIAPVGNGMEAP